MMPDDFSTYNQPEIIINVERIFFKSGPRSCGHRFFQFRVLPGTFSIPHTDGFRRMRHPYTVTNVYHSKEFFPNLPLFQPINRRKFL